MSARPSSPKIDFRPAPGTRGTDILQGSNKLLGHAMRDVASGLARAAREDVCVFFEFVMRTEKGQKPVKITPHQRLIFEFLMAHERAVLVLPIGTSKTFCVSAFTLWLIGRNPELRGVVVSATQSQAAKVVDLVRQYIETSAELKLVFPDLRPARREGAKWTQTAITVDRPPGIKDATLAAYGLDGNILGSRLDWVIADDTLSQENTGTEDARKKVADFVNESCFGRLEVLPTSKAIVTNSPWHTNDLVGRCIDAGWATLRMSIDGEINIRDDKHKEQVAKQFKVPWEPFDSDLVRPSTDNPNDLTCRLVAHDPDPNNVVPLWPEKFPPMAIEELRQKNLPYVFNRQYRCVVRDDDTARCKQEYIDKCLLLARRLGVFSMVSEYKGPNPTFTGVDLAISPGEEHDDTAMFTFESRPDGTRVILDYERGQWAGPDTMRKIIAKQKAYNSVVNVENNAAQEFLLQFMREVDKSLPIKGHTTGRAKAHPEHGVEGFFLEMSNGAWAFPNDRTGAIHPMIKRLIDACLYYTPSKHTDDGLMATFLGRALARSWGVGPKRNENGAGGGDIGANILSR